MHAASQDVGGETCDRINPRESATERWVTNEIERWPEAD
jgi:hypothetical protein